VSSKEGHARRLVAQIRDTYPSSLYIAQHRHDSFRSSRAGSPIRLEREQ
jgi:hypothetical protein